MRRESNQLNLFGSPLGSIMEASSIERIDDASDFSSRIRGRIEKIVSYDSSTGECVLDTRCETTQKPLLISTRLPSVWPGMTFTAQFTEPCLTSTGSSEHSPIRSVSGLKLGEPNTKRTLKKFLKSQPLGPLGKVTIESLASDLPGEFLSILKSSPQRLRQVPGIGRSRLNLLIERFQDFNAHLTIREFLFNEGLPLDGCERLWAAYRTDSIAMLMAHPYRCVRMQGLPFDSVDAFALRRGCALDDPERLAAAFEQILEQSYRLGHCACPDGELLDHMVARLNVSRDKIEDSLELALVCGDLVSEEIDGVPCIYQRETWELERNVARRLLEFAKNNENPLHLDPAKMVRWTQQWLDIRLSPLQNAAVEQTLRSSLTVITGGPGTGKTTLIQCLVAILESQSIRYALCAPTGRAAQRLSEATGVKGSTIHRLLQFNGLTSQFARNRSNPLDIDMLLIDEASMIDLSLMSHVLEALPPSCALVLIGDANQLPSVGSGAVLQSLISSGRFPVVELTDIYRQKSDSGIRLNADRIRRGLMPTEGSRRATDFRYLPIRNADEAVSCVKTLLLNTLPKECGVSDLKQVQILSPMNQGALGSQHLNAELRDLFTTHVKSGESEGPLRFRTGDKVMVIKNNYHKNIFNGDIGTVVRVRTDPESIEVDFFDRIVSFHFDELQALTLAYAISIHKSQGSEYPTVIVVLTKDHLSVAQRHLLYTAVTRGKTHVFLVADPETLKSAISRSDKRWQNLTALLSL